MPMTRSPSTRHGRPIAQRRTRHPVRPRPATDWRAGARAWSVAALLAIPFACAWGQQQAPASTGGETSKAEALQEAAGIAQRAASALEAAKPAPWSEQERAFLQAARASSAFAVEAGRIGMRRGTDPAVKNLAQQLAAEHGAAVKELDGMAQSRGLRLPGASTAAQQRSLHQLRTTGGFDTAFVRSVGVGAQQGDVALYKAAQARIRDPELKAWIAARLQRLGEQLTTAQQIPLRHALDRTPNSGRNEATPAAPANDSHP